MKFKIFSVFSLFFLLSYSDQVRSHSGGLNGQGCHGGSRPYHCHRSSSEMVPSSSGRYRLRCDLGSRSQDCGSSHDLKTIKKTQFPTFETPDPFKFKKR